MVKVKPRVSAGKRSEAALTFTKNPMDFYKKN
jgi:hypothetical protein